MINFMIQKSNEESGDFFKFMKGIFGEVYKPEYKRKRNEDDE